MGYVPILFMYVSAIGILELFAHCKGGNLIFISGRGSAIISSAKEGKSGPIYNLSKS